MEGTPTLKYEKPVSIDLGRVAPILGDTCSLGQGAADCMHGANNAMQTICGNGAHADNTCQMGAQASTFCYPHGAGAAVACLTGHAFK